MNARLQGLYKIGHEGAAPLTRVLYNTATGKPITGSDRQKAIRFATVAGAVTSASIGLMLAYRGDPDWEKRTESDRDGFWWFKIGSTAFRIPKPFEIGALASIAERGVEAMADGMDADARTRFLNRLGAITMDNLSLNPVPQFVKPMVELYANKDFYTGMPIESMGMQNLEPAERIGARTSAAAQLLGKNNVLSPVQIDHLIRGYFGWLGSHIAMTADLALRPAMGLPTKPAWRTEDIPVIGDFAKQLPSDQTRFLSLFYDQARQVQQAFSTMRYYQQIHELGKAQDYLNENRADIALHKLYSQSSAKMTKINHAIRHAQAMDTDADTKRAMLDNLYQLRSKIAETTVKAAKSDRERLPAS